MTARSAVQLCGVGSLALSGRTRCRCLLAWLCLTERERKRKRGDRSLAADVRSKQRQHHCSSLPSLPQPGRNTITDPLLFYSRKNPRAACKLLSSVLVCCSLPESLKMILARLESTINTCNHSIYLTNKA